MMEREPEEIQNNSAEAEAAAPEDVELLRKALSEERERAAGYLANWQRAQADFVNYKRRIEQEREDFARSSHAALILSILHVLDDLERALSSIPHRQERQPWVEGVRMVERKLRNTLEAQGVTAIEALGQPFDPNYHEAVRQDRGEEGIVVQEMRKGYMLYDKVLRPSMVVVGNGEKEEE